MTLSQLVILTALGVLCVSTYIISFRNMLNWKPKYLYISSFVRVATATAFIGYLLKVLGVI